MILSSAKNTEMELAVNNHRQLFSLAKIAGRDLQQFYEICNAFPFYININSIHTLNPVFVNRHFADLMELDRKEVVEGGLDLIKSISHLPTLQFAVSKIRSFEAAADHHSICSYLQYMKFHGKWQWMLTYKMFLNDKLYLNMGQEIEKFGGIGHIIRNTLGETMITQNGWQKFQSLTKREKEILKMIASGHSRGLARLIWLASATVTVMQRRSLAGCGCGDPTRRRIIWRKPEHAPRSGARAERACGK